MNTLSQNIGVCIIDLPLVKQVERALLSWKKYGRHNSRPFIYNFLRLDINRHSSNSCSLLLNVLLDFIWKNRKFDDKSYQCLFLHRFTKKENLSTRLVKINLLLILDASAKQFHLKSFLFLRFWRLFRLVPSTDFGFFKSLEGDSI